MGFTYHPPTRDYCTVCDNLSKIHSDTPVIETIIGKASASNGYPFHDWYNFVLGFTPIFPEFILEREHITAESGDVILDPFGGAGTTQLVCKLKGIPSFGVDANDFMVFAAQQKLHWRIKPELLQKLKALVTKRYNEEASSIDWSDNIALEAIANNQRPAALDARYISDKPLIKILILKKVICGIKSTKEYKDLLSFAVSAILVPVSNVKYGPGFGVGKHKDDVDVISIFSHKIDKMTNDLSRVSDMQKETYAKTCLGDSRRLSDCIPESTISLIITSPPYPGDHEYTKHSKLELIYNGFATDLSSFRTIKKRMIRGSTTNIYREDSEQQYVKDISEIRAITDEIEQRLVEDGASSGFEKLYAKLVWEYFGGMSQALMECFKVLKPGGKIALLVSDSHAFKMVHIQTADLLRIIGEKIGYINSEIILWQLKTSTSHTYQLRENVLLLQKP